MFKNKIILTHTNSISKKPFFPWLVWIMASSYFFGGYFVRVSPSVMALNLMSDLHASALIVGLLSACFYYPYVAMQVPVGLLVDKHGAQRLLSIMAVFAGIGCLIFANAHHVWVACLSRVIIGFSMAFAFVGAVKLSSSWHSGSRLGLIVGLTQGSGMLGAALGSLPVAWGVVHVGWRPTLWIMAMVLCFIALCIALWAPDKMEGMAAQKEKNFTSMQYAIRLVLQNPQTWVNALFVGLFYAPTTAFAELWGITFLQQVHNVPLETAALLNGLIFLGWSIGGPFLGWLSDNIHSRRKVMFWSSLICCFIFSMILFLSNLHLFFLAFLLFAFGFSNSGVSISYTLSTEINPKFVAGTSLAFANMASVLIGAILQPIIGLLLDISGHIEYINNVPVYSKAAFQWSLFLLLIGLLMASLLVYKIRETKGKINDY